jgi:iron-sulfur cluster repair protein YtfE (RIC family)
MLIAVDSPTPSTVRQCVLEQHTVLREVFRRVLKATTDVLRGEGDSADPAGLAALVRDFRHRFRAHLAYEESHLVPVLAEVDIWGPQRVANLLHEHSCQRGELDALLDGIEAGWDPHRIAVTARGLVSELLGDMAEEERGCLSAQLLRDDVVNVDQATD